MPPTRGVWVASGMLETATSTRVASVSAQAGLRWLEAEAPRPARALGEALGASVLKEGAPLLSALAPPLKDLIELGWRVGQARVGRIQEIEGLPVGLDRLGAEDTDRITVVRALLVRSKWQAVRRVIASGAFLDSSRRDEARRLLSDALARANRGTEARIVMASIERPHFRHLAEADLARAEDARGRHQQAVRRARRIESKWVRAQALADLALRAHRRGHTQRSLRLLEDAEKEARSIDNPLLRDEALLHLAKQAWLAGGQAKIVDRLIDDVAERSETEFELWRLGRLVRNRRVARAQAKVEELKGPAGLTDRGRADVAVLEARHNEVGRALERAAGLTVPELRWQSLGRVAGVAPEHELNEIEIATLIRALEDGFNL